MLSRTMQSALRATRTGLSSKASATGSMPHVSKVNPSTNVPHQAHLFSTNSSIHRASSQLQQARGFAAAASKGNLMAPTQPASNAAAAGSAVAPNPAAEIAKPGEFVKQVWANDAGGQVFENVVPRTKLGIQNIAERGADKGTGLAFTLGSVGAGALGLFMWDHTMQGGAVYHAIGGHIGPLFETHRDHWIRDGSNSSIPQIRAARRESLSQFKEHYWQQPDPMKGKYDARTWKNRGGNGDLTEGAHTHGRLVKTKSYRPGSPDNVHTIRQNSYNNGFRPQKSQRVTPFVYDGDNVPKPKRKLSQRSRDLILGRQEVNSPDL